MDILSAPLAPGHRLFTSDTMTVVDPSKPQRFAYWSQPVFRGTVSRQAVETLVRSAAAEALAGKLSEQTRRNLADHVSRLDEQIVDVGLQYHAEYLAAGQQMEEEPGNHVVIHARPHEKDARWAEVVALKARLKRSEGLLYCEPYRASKVRYEATDPNVPFVYAFLAWERWHILERYKEKYNALLYKRLLATRKWIEESYACDGMQIFDQ
jgi:hypothetical protein